MLELLGDTSHTLFRKNDHRKWPAAFPDDLWALFLLCFDRRGELLAGKERIYFDLLDRNESGAALMHEQRGSAGSIEAVIHDLSLL